MTTNLLPPLTSAITLAALTTLILRWLHPATFSTISIYLLCALATILITITISKS